MIRESALTGYGSVAADAHNDGDVRTRLAEELVSFLAPTAVEAEQYRTLRHVVERLHRDSGVRVFAVTSAGPGDGKTVTTLNLAGSLAQSRDARVLVVCADLHRAAAVDYLGLARLRPRGLADAIIDEGVSLADVVLRLDALNISFLAAGDAAPARPYELLASARLDGLLDEARERYDYVLIDTPPVAPLADCRLLGRCVDGFLIVVAAHQTPRKLLAEALSHLDPAKILGLVFNADDRPLAAYYGYYGSQQVQTSARTSRLARWRRPSEPRGRT